MVENKNEARNKETGAEDALTIRIHADSRKYVVKPTRKEIGSIKRSMAQSKTIMDLTVKQIADRILAGMTIEPGVCPLSDESQDKGRKGTVKEDFTQQQMFLIDIDNDAEGEAQETPEGILNALTENSLKPSFMYYTFSDTPEKRKFRVALVCDDVITDHGERDRIQEALNRLSPQSDRSCKNTDRMYLGTSKGLVEGYTDFEAVCRKEDLISLAERCSEATQAEVPEQPSDVKHISGSDTEKKVSGTIQVGERNNTLSQLAGKLLKRYGDEDGKALEAFRQCLSKCEEPLDHGEVNSIWKSALSFYRGTVKSNAGYVSPEEYVKTELRRTLEPEDYTDIGQATVLEAVYGDRIRYSDETGFLVYNGKVWQEDDIKAQKLSQELTERQFETAKKRVRTAQEALNTAVETKDENAITVAKKTLGREERFRKFVIKRRSSANVNSALKEVRPKVQVNVEQLDSDGYLLNTPGGTVDLRTGIIKPNDPEDYCTKITAVAPGDVFGFPGACNGGR